MQTITTKYHGPTDLKGSRISASTADGTSVYVGYKYALSSFENHREAAKKLKDKLDWKGRMIAGGTYTGYVFMVWIDD